MEDSPLDLGPHKRVAKILAQQLLKKVGVTQAPVSLQQVIEYLQTTRDIEVLRMNVGQKVSGMVVVCTKLDEEYATIGFNENHPWYRRRFTIAHEIGHVILGHTCNGNEGDSSHNETEAHTFAAELLMPTELLKKDFKKIHNLDNLSVLYRVSKHALTIQIMNAHLI